MVMLSEISAATETFYERLPLDRTRGTSSRGPAELEKGIRLAFQKKERKKKINRPCVVAFFAVF